jgi:uncharacterized protein
MPYQVEKIVFQYFRTFIEIILRIKVAQALKYSFKHLTMINLGQFNKLEVIKLVDFGVYLDGGEDEILMPQKYVPERTEVGDVLYAFIYRDSEDRLIATTQKPLACVGDIVLLKVVDTNRFGVFLNWGLEKDLMVPFSQQNKKMVVGNSYVVKVYIDEQTNRILASARIERFLNYQTKDLEEGEAVDLLPFEYTDLGIKTVVNNQYLGMLYHTELFKPIKLGLPKKGFIKKVRSDYKLDVTLNRQGYGEVLDCKDILLQKLRESNGFLPLTDRSEPEVIYEQLHMSKKVFKKAVGGLLKDKKVNLLNDGLQLIEASFNIN